MYYANAADNKFILPGRLRIYIKELKNNPIYCERIHCLLSKTIGIHSVKANHFTGKVLVYFDEKKIDVSTLENLMMEAQHLNIIPAGSAKYPTSDGIMTKLLKQKEFKRVVIAGTVLTGILVKQIFFGRTTLAEDYRIFTIASAATILTGYPLFKKGIDRLQQRGINYELILSFCAFSCILLRESTLSLFVITTAYLSEAIMKTMEQHSMKFLEECFHNGNTKVYKLVEGQPLEISYDAIVPGDMLLFTAGDFLPVDGEISSGEAVICQKSFNGESMPHGVKTGDKVYAGTKIAHGSIQIIVKAVGEDTEYSKILSLLDNTWKTKWQLENRVDQSYHQWMPLAAVLSFIGFAVTGDIMILITLLLIACPKPAYHATPIAIRTAMTRAYMEGIVIKNPYVIEKSSKASRVIFDKTGTLTLGREENGTQDPLRRESIKAINLLKMQGLRNFEILSGDRREFVEKIASELGIENYQGGLSAKDKALRVQAAKEEGNIIMMVGDGINDVPALNHAHVGILMTEHPDPNMLPCADVLLLNNNILSVPRLIDLSRCTMDNINQSYRLSISMNFFGVLLVLINGINPFFASFYKDINSLLVLLNAMRLSKTPLKYLNRQVN